VINTQYTFTVGDFAALKALENHWSERDHELLPALRRKLESARIVFQTDLPRHVATVGSQVAYTIDRGELETRTLTSLAAPGGHWLPVQHPLGLAILGRREGEVFEVSGQDIHLHRVFDQPEANWPGRFQQDPGPPTQAQVRLVPGSGSRRGLDLVATADEDDDPGPSAA
jgi:hypothetical protein